MKQKTFSMPHVLLAPFITLQQTIQIHVCEYYEEHLVNPILNQSAQ